MFARRLPRWTLSVALLATGSAWAQDPPSEVVLPPENVRYDYAQVLDVSPIYQTLRTTSVERICDVRPGHSEDGALTRVVDAVKGRLGGKATVEERKAGLVNCRMAPVTREYRRPIAYDVDYAYKGAKFRTRLARDPGNRLRIRITITPQPGN
ncbi:MAG: hypothetical protein EOP93_16175 [Lysobacteraceae bacterium]|nr:MAG: hypothetical protein EOP93_16175 [Xanthomonadaceae bacterium]